MAAKIYRLKIVYQGREVEAEGDKAFVLEMFQRYGDSSRPQTDVLERGRNKGGSKAPPSNRLPDRKSLSIREFIQQLDLKKHTDITLAFGYYLERHQGLTEFTPRDINNCYYEAKLESSNTSQMIIQNIRSGRLMPSKAKGDKGKNRYTLTRSGEQFVESKLPANS